MNNFSVGLNYRISKSANLFHFISNLTSWHFSVRTVYRDIWLQETGPLSSNEKKVLGDIEKLFQKYSFGPKYWGRVFLVESDSKVWQVAKNKFNTKELQLFQSAAEVFLPRFKKVWRKEKFLLNYWACLLKENNKKFPSKQLIDDLNIFFGTDVEIKQVTVILLISSEYYFNGGANLDPGIVTLEIGINSSQVIQRSLMVLWHELIHSFWQNRQYEELIDKIAKEKKSKLRLSQSFFGQRPLENIINEAILESLLPKGYLAQKYFSFNTEENYDREIDILKNHQKDMSYWRTYAGYHLMPISRKYIENGRSLDALYIRQVLRVLKKFIK
ncbi:hypothetical protein M1563_02875 [Patescibacteria group bacterium]|nr:hypothetical protein [Patescibacteria group bacterium]